VCLNNRHASLGGGSWKEATTALGPSKELAKDPPGTASPAENFTTSPSLPKVSKKWAFKRATEVAESSLKLAVIGLVGSSKSNSFASTKIFKAVEIIQADCWNWEKTEEFIG
jgi:hypothetical protein